MGTYAPVLVWLGANLHIALQENHEVCISDVQTHHCCDAAQGAVRVVVVAAEEEGGGAELHMEEKVREERKKEKSVTCRYEDRNKLM